MENKKVSVVVREVGVEGVRAELLSKKQLELFNQDLKKLKKEGADILCRAEAVLSGLMKGDIEIFIMDSQSSKVLVYLVVKKH